MYFLVVGVWYIYIIKKQTNETTAAVNGSTAIFIGNEFTTCKYSLENPIPNTTTVKLASNEIQATVLMFDIMAMPIQ